MTFGDKLKKYREEHGISQEQLGATLGTSKQVISRYEKGQRSPQLDTVQSYARKLGLPVVYLADNSCDRIMEQEDNSLTPMQDALWRRISGMSDRKAEALLELLKHQE